jgi:hypothetical protein
MYCGSFLEKSLENIFSVSLHLNDLIMDISISAKYYCQSVSATFILLVLPRARISSVRFFASATLINGKGLWMGDATPTDASVIKGDQFSVVIPMPLLGLTVILFYAILALITDS